MSRHVKVESNGDQSYLSDPIVFDASRGMKVLIVDPLVTRRESLKFMLRSQCKDYTFTSCSALELPINNSFDVVLLSIDTIGDAMATSLGELENLVRLLATTPVVAIAERECASIAMQVLKAGFRGYISMCLEVPLVVAAIRLVCAGGTFIPECCLARAASISRRKMTEASSLPSEDRLTSREEQILDLVREGRANKIIAHQLGISESTVKVHLQHIMRKMQVTNRTEVALRSHEIVFGSGKSSPTTLNLGDKGI